MMKKFGFLLQGISLSFAFFSVIVFLFLPTSTFQKIFQLNETQVTKYEWVVPAVLGVGALLLYLYSIFFKGWEESSNLTYTNTPLRENSKWMLPLLITLSLLVFIRAVAGIEKPFDNDELNVLFHVTRGDSLGPLFHDSTHPLSTYLGVFFVKLFGVSAWAIRLPSVLFCIAFLAVLIPFCLKAASLLTSLLLIGHLASSSIFIWYFHSTRGYAPMVLFCFTIFSVFYSITVQKQPLTNKKKWLLLISYCLLPFTHGYGILLGIWSVIALTFWLVLNRGNISSTENRTLSNLCLKLTAVLPIYSICLAYMFSRKMLEGNKYIGIDSSSPIAKSTLFGAFGTALGFGHDIALKTVFVLVCLCLIHIFHTRKFKEDFTLQLLSMFLGFIVLQKTLLQTSIAGRFFLCILPIFVFWLCQTIANMKSKTNKYALFSIVFIALIIFPVLDGKPGLFQLDHESYYEFIKTVRRDLKGIPANCLDISAGDQDPSSSEAFIAKNIYLKSTLSNESSTCSKKYQLKFDTSWNQEHGKSQNFFEKKNYNIIYSDGYGRTLASIE